MNTIICQTFLMALLAGLLIGTPLRAREDLPSTVSLRTLALAPDMETDLFIRSEDAYEPLGFSHYQPSKALLALTASGRAVLPLYRQVPAESGETVYAKAREVRLPEGASQVILLGTRNGEGVALVAVKDNLGADERDWLLVNATRRPIAFQLGSDTKPRPIPPGEAVFYRVEVPSGKGAAVRVAAFMDEGWERFYSTFWPVYEGQRGLIIFVPDGERVRLSNFFETVAEAQPDA